MELEVKALYGILGRKQCHRDEDLIVLVGLPNLAVKQLAGDWSTKSACRLPMRAVSSCSI
jgi:hypothetical protein